jgi:hypothetical protein
MGYVEDIENYFEMPDNHHPTDESCQCGGTIMTPEHDFSGADATGY